MNFKTTEFSWHDSMMVPMLAQDETASPGLPDEAANPATQQDPGDPAQGGGAQPMGLFNPLTLMLLILVPIILFSMMGQRKEKKKREQMLGGMKKHDHVQTIGGVIGSIVSINNDHIVLKVDESTNTRIKFARSAVSQVLPDGRKAASQDVTPIEAPNN